MAMTNWKEQLAESVADKYVPEPRTTADGYKHDRVWQIAMAVLDHPDYVVVPREPTEAMLIAGQEQEGEGTYLDYFTLLDIYKAMLKAACGGNDG